VKQSAGTLLYRLGPSGFEVLIVHPSGGYNRHAPWSLPKGEANTDEPLEMAARRETEEETGVRAEGLLSLGSVDLPKGRKRVFGFAGPAPEDAAPRCASWEVDRAEFVPLAEARARLHPAQAPFIDRLRELLAEA
jgi:predicted NUDIX family NTP pyrophosphohydrolase